MVLFLGGWLWVWAPARRAEFDAAALLPLETSQEDGDDR
jgi:cytochrome c oxidase cbb3-type subunit 4